MVKCNVKQNNRKILKLGLPRISGFVPAAITAAQMRFIDSLYIVQEVKICPINLAYV